MTDDELDRLDALAQDATPGPWDFSAWSEREPRGFVSGPDFDSTLHDAGYWSAADGKLIASSRLSGGNASSVATTSFKSCRSLPVSRARFSSTSGGRGGAASVNSARVTPSARAMALRRSTDGRSN